MYMYIVTYVIYLEEKRTKDDLMDKFYSIILN